MIQVVRRLIQHKDVTGLHQDLCQCQTFALTAGELVGVQARDLLGKAVAGEQLPAPGAAAGGIGATGRTASPRYAFHLAPHPHERIEACHRLGHKGNAAPALGGQGRRVHGTAVEPDAPAHERVGLEQAQHRVGQKRLARARGAHHGDDLPLVHGKAQ